MNKRKKDFLFIFIFILVATASLFYLANSSYAKYKRKVDAEVQNRIANWNIKVNNELIINKTTLTNDITPTIETNEYVKEGTLAPGISGYFDVTINAQDVDVDFIYSIQGETDEDTPLLDLIVTEYEINGKKVTNEKGKVLSGELKRNTGDTPIRIYFKWNDDEDNLMNNQEDTKYAANPNNKYTNIKVSITFTQKNG